MPTDVSPFTDLTNLGFSKQVWGRYFDTGMLGVEPDGEHRLHLPGIIGGQYSTFAVAGPYAYGVDVALGPSIWRREINVGTLSSASAGIYYGNTIATDGAFLYVVGPDATGLSYEVAKLNLDMTPVWVQTFSGYTDGGLLTITANPLGFSVHSNTIVRFHDPDGLLLNTVSGLLMLGVPNYSCATRDRLFLPDQNLTPPGEYDPQYINSYTADGTLQYRFPIDTPTEIGWSPFAVTEWHVAVFYRPWDGMTYGPLAARIFPRTVVRDGSGVITADSVDTVAAADYVLTPDGYINAATVDASTFWQY